MIFNIEEVHDYNNFVGNIIIELQLYCNFNKNKSYSQELILQFFFLQKNKVSLDRLCMLA